MKICAICHRPESEHHEPMFINDPRPNMIIEAVAKEFGTTAQSLKGQTRMEHIAVPRMVAMELIWKHCGMPQKDVVKFLNRRDHGTASNAIKRVQNMRSTDKQFRSLYDSIESKINL